MLLPADARAALAVTAIASTTFNRRRRSIPSPFLSFPATSSRLDPSFSLRQDASTSSSSCSSQQGSAMESFLKEGKPTICTADELHYAPVPGTDWRLALWRYTPPPEAPKRNHPLMLLSGVGTNAIGFDLSPAASFARHMSSQGFDTWVVEVRGAGLSVQNESQQKITEPVRTPTSNPTTIKTKTNGTMSLVPAWDELKYVNKLTASFTRVAETLTGYVNKSQLKGLNESFFDQVSKLLEDTQLTNRLNDITERISILVEAGQGSAITEQVMDLSQKMVKVLEEGQETVSPPLFDLQEKFAATIEDFQRQLDLILTYDWDFDHYLEEDIPAAMSYISLHSGSRDGKLLAIGHSMGGIILYAMIAKCCYGKEEPRLAGAVTIASSIDYTTSNSSLKLLLPLADPAQALNVPAVPLGALLRAAYRPYHSSGPPYLLSWFNGQITAQDMMHPELFSKLVLNNFCTVPAKVLLQLTTAFHEGGLCNRTGEFYFKKHLQNCNVPVLALAGDKDLICPPEAVYETVKLLPQNMVTYKVFGKPGGPHYAHYDLVGGRLSIQEHPHMETIKLENPESIGSVKAAISIFGERINGKKQENNKNQEGIENTHEKHNRLTHQFEAADTKTTEFHTAGNQIARKPIKTISTNCDEDVTSQLDKMKRELRKLQLDVKNVFEAKKLSERQAEASAFRAQLAASKVDELKRKIEEANEEHVIVELARIEAERETREIEGKREAEANKYKKEAESIKERINKLQRETGRAKELEERLAITNTDVEVLQNEMQFVRAMETNTSKKGKDEVDRTAELEKVEGELKLVKKEMESVKEEGFQYMAYMDRTRGEIVKIREEVFLLKEKEKKVDSIVQNLNSKLLKAKSKLETASASDERTKAIVASLQSALDQMQSEVDNANEEKESIIEETNRIRSETEKNWSEKNLSEERAQQLVQELQAAKASERAAMKSLKSAIERTVVDRFYKVDQRKSGNTVTVSKSEYNYLIRGANDAKLVADKKVEACQAWVEALRSGEKVIKMRTELMHKEAERLKAMKDQTINETERDVELDMEMYESMNACMLSPNNACLLSNRRPAREGRVSLTSKGVKVRRVSVSSMARVSASSVSRVSVSSASRVNNGSPSLNIKRKKKMVPNLMKFIRIQRRRRSMGEPSK